MNEFAKSTSKPRVNESRMDEINKFVALIQFSFYFIQSKLKTFSLINEIENKAEIECHKLN